MKGSFALRGFVYVLVILSYCLAWGGAKPMSNFNEDPVNVAIYGTGGIMTAIGLLFSSNCVIPGVMMIMCGIDIMSNLDREDPDESKPADFKNWVEKYMHMRGDDVLTADDIWGARCALLHTYGVFSRDVRSGKARIIIWLQNPWVPVYHAPDVDPGSVRVDPFEFKRAFSEGVRKFLTDASSGERKELIDDRLRELITYSRFIDERRRYRGESE